MEKVVTPIPCNEAFSIKKNKLPYIRSMFDTGVKVLSMKINYLAPFKHKHKHLKLVHEN
jgi:hypothetical protein